MARETVGEAFVALRVDKDAFTKETSTAVSSGVKTAAGAAAGLLAGYGIKSFLSGVNSEARESQKVGAQTEAVLRSTAGAANIQADAVSNLAGTLSKKVGIDDEVIQSGENMLLTFKNIRNEQGKGNDIFNQTTVAALDMAAGMAAASGGEVDMKSATIQLGKALNDPIKGITALTRVGVTFTEQQKEQITRMVESGNVLGAQKVILKEVMGEFGGSAAANATDADKATVAIGNFKEAIGTALLPVLDKGANLLTTVADAFTSLPAPVREGATWLGVAAGGALAVAFAVEKLGAAKTVLSDFFGSIKDGASKATGKLGGEGGFLGLSSAAGAWVGVAGLAAGAAYGLSLALNDNADAVDFNARALRQAGDRDIEGFIRKVQSLGDKLGGSATGKLHNIFQDILEQDAGQAQRFVDALDRAGLKTGWYSQKLEEHNTAEAKAKNAEDSHRGSVDKLADSYQNNTTKLEDNLKALDEATSKLDAMENKDLAAARAQNSLTDALDAQFGAFLAAAQAGGTNAEANKALERQTLATKEAILQDAQAVRDSVTAHFGGVAGAQAYRDELVRLGNQVSGPLHDYILGLIADLDRVAGTHAGTITLNAEPALTAIGAVDYALGQLATGHGTVLDQIAAGGGNPAAGYASPNPYAGVQQILNYLGSLPGHASGGWVEGSGNRDSVLSWLTPGEYVMSKAEVAASKAGGDQIHLHYERMPRNGVQIAVEAFRGLRAAREAAAL